MNLVFQLNYELPQIHFFQIISAQEISKLKDLRLNNSSSK
jgi:hypothetical protein